MSNWGLINLYSDWGSLEDGSYFGDIYIIEYLTSTLNNRVQEYDNFDGTNLILEQLQ